MIVKTAPTPSTSCQSVPEADPSLLTIPALPLSGLAIPQPIPHIIDVSMKMCFTGRRNTPINVISQTDEAWWTTIVSGLDAKQDRVASRFGKKMCNPIKLTTIS